MKHKFIKIVKKVWGEERWIVNEKGYCGKALVINKSSGCSLHRHPVKEETFYVSWGYGVIEVEGEKQMIFPGDIIDIKPFQLHRYSCDHTCGMVLVEFSTHHEDDDVERKEPSYGHKGNGSK